MKVKKLWAIILSMLVVGVLTFSVFGCAPEVEKEKVFKIADINAFSGPAAPWGWMLQHSLEMAAEDINELGGIKVGGDYYKVEVPRYDHAYDPSVAVSVTRKAIYNDGIKYAFILGGGNIYAVNDLLQSEKVISFGVALGTGWIGPKYPYTFKPYHDIADSLDVILEYALQKHPDYNRIAIMYPDDDMGRDTAARTVPIAEAGGWEIVDVIYSDRATTDFYPALTGLLAKGVDIIEFGGTPPSQQALIIKQARELGFKGIFTFPDAGMELTTIEPIAGIEALEGSLGGPMYVEMPTAVGKSWQERYVARAGGLYPWTSWSYDAMFLLKAAIEKANTFDADEVMEALETVSFDGTSGTISFGGEDVYGLNRAFLLDVYVVEIINGELTQVHHGIARRWR